MTLRNVGFNIRIAMPEAGKYLRQRITRLSMHGCYAYFGYIAQRHILRNIVNIRHFR